MLTLCVVAMGKKKVVEQETWPDGTPISTWFSDTSRVDVSTLGKRYVVTDYGVSNYSTQVQTRELQAVIDRCASEGGGVVVIPRGFVISGSLFFKPGTHLYIEENGELRGSDRIRDFQLVKTRMEGQTLTYFAALVNADGCDGFTITGPGTINGNGQAYWEEFWIRRKYNPQCTNLEAMRPRNVYISNCKNVTVQDVHIINSPFWTNHLYKCENVRYLGCYIFAPVDNITPLDPQRGAPSSDAIDIDVCKNVLISGCYMSVCDDAVVLKGGKGTFADQSPDNGPNSFIMISDCTYGRVHGCLTLGSESIHDRNVILRRCNIHPTLLLHGTADSMVAYNKLSMGGRGIWGSDFLATQWAKKGYIGWCIYRFKDRPHDVAAYMSYLWDIEEAFLEQNVILGHPRTVDATVDDPTLPTWTVTQLDLSVYSNQ